MSFSPRPVRKLVSGQERRYQHKCREHDYAKAVHRHVDQHVPVVLRLLEDNQTQDAGNVPRQDHEAQEAKGSFQLRAW